jgi:TM2 domain-containing membrane protein YozV
MPQPAQPPQYAQPPQPYASAQKSSRSKAVAGILAILLGTLGAHKFYLGQTGWGIVYLLFFWTWIPTIAGIIEGLIYLTMSDDAFERKYGGR